MRSGVIAFSLWMLPMLLQAEPPSEATPYPPPKTKYILPVGFRGACREVFDREHGQGNRIHAGQPGEVEVLKIPVSGELRVKEDPWWTYIYSIPDKEASYRVQLQWDVTAEFADGSPLPTEDHRDVPHRRPHVDDNAIALRFIFGTGRGELDGVENDGVIFMFVGTQKDADAAIAEMKTRVKLLPPRR